MNNNIIVTSYPNPDIDGVACIFAYSELLNKQGGQADPVVFGKPHMEAMFVLNKFLVPEIRQGEGIDFRNREVILVDTSDPLDIPESIKPDQVIEIIDHRKIHQADKFPNAKIGIELVGSAGTLIGEKFYQENIKPSKYSAILLFSAIISNTINFKGDVTTQRDRKIAKWLESMVNIPSGYIDSMFMSKSKIEGPLSEVFCTDLKKGIFSGGSFGIAQLEIVGVEKFISDRIKEIKQALIGIKNTEKLDYVFLNCIDVKEDFNIIIVGEEKTKVLLEKSLNLKFDKETAKTKKILMRKQIIPLLK